MDQSYLRAFESLCIQEEPPACQTMCPLHVEAKNLATLMAEGKHADARKVLERTMPLPGLVGLLCEGACVAHCRRHEVDGGLNMPLLERACLQNSRPSKTLALPSSGKRVAVCGAGLSSLCLAHEIAKKGHSVTVYHTQPAGGRLLSVPKERLAAGALQEALDLLAALRVQFAPVPAFGSDWLRGVIEDYQALYIGLDDPALSPFSFEATGLPARLDALTGATDHPKVFAGGEVKNGPPAFIHEAADGKRAAGSITRLLQGVSPATAREKEDVYPTLLYTDISGVTPAPPVTPADALAPTVDEAAAEARRCIRCECMECAKRCAYLASYKGYPKKYAREMYNNLSVVHGLRRTNTQINSCAQCGLCAAVCPHNADMGAFCAEARREMVRTKRMPPSAHEFALEDMAYSNSRGIAFFRHQPGQHASAWAFFPGCQLPASMPEATLQCYLYLTMHLEGGTGLWFHCCGAPARWSGREMLTRNTADALRADWEQAGRPKLVIACASCAAFFKAELPDIPAESLWDTLAGLPLPSQAVATPDPLALHDPCANRHEAATRAAVRRIVQAAGQTTEELPLGQELTRCCGYGGLASAANPQLGDAYAQSRADDTQHPILSYCIMCRDRLRAVGKASLHLLDLLFPLGNPHDVASRPAPGIAARQETRLAFRRRLLQDLWNESPERNPEMEQLTLNIDDASARRLEARRILRTDVKEVLLHAAKNGPLFHNAATGRSLASLRPKQVTFWVEYAKEPDGSYTIHDAYCHRMVVPGVPGEGRDTACSLEGYAPKGGRM